MSASRLRYSSDYTAPDPAKPSYSTSNLRAYQTPDGGLKICTSRSASPVLSSSLLSSRRYVSKAEPDPASAYSSLTDRVAERIGSAPSSLRRREGDELESWRRPETTITLAKEKERALKEKDDSDFIAKEKDRLAREPPDLAMPPTSVLSGMRAYARSNSNTSTSSPTRAKKPEYYTSGRIHRHLLSRN